MNGAVSQWMQRVQRSAIATTPDDDDIRSMSLKRRRDVASTRFKDNNDNDEPPWRKYSAEAQSRRGVRSILPPVDSNGLYTVRTCTLYMQADQKLWEYIFNHEGQRSNQRYLRNVCLFLLLFALCK